MKHGLTTLVLGSDLVDSDVADNNSNVVRDDVTVEDSMLDTEGMCDGLDDDIAELDVQDAIRASKQGKAAGPDGLSGEFYKY